jgi:hypothetical protein
MHLLLHLLHLLLWCCILGGGRGLPAPAQRTPATPATPLPVFRFDGRGPEPPPTLHTFSYARRYRTSASNSSLVLTFKKRAVSLESGARFLFSPEWFPTDKVTFSYKFRVGRSFNFVRSGKLPGIYLGTFRGGYSTGKAYKAGQGSFRPTWQINGTSVYVEPYLYGAHGSYKASRDAQGPATSAAIGPGGSRAGLHLWSREDGDFDLRRGRWNEVRIHVTLNDVGRANGVARVTINGNTEKLTDVSFRDREATRIQSVAMECFFGGGSKSHMTPGYTQRIEFKDVYVYDDDV